MSNSTSHQGNVKLRNIPAIPALIYLFHFLPESKHGPHVDENKFPDWMYPCMRNYQFMDQWRWGVKVRHNSSFKKDCEIQSWWYASIALPPITNCKCSSRINKMNIDMNKAQTDKKETQHFAHMFKELIAHQSCSRLTHLTHLVFTSFCKL